MHEFGLVDSFMDAVLSRAGDRRVTGVKMRIGVLHRVMQESLAQAFAFSCAGTVAEGASLELVTVPVALSCRSCATVTQVAEILPDCPVCQAPSPLLKGGDELILESITFAGGHDGASTPAEVSPRQG